MNCWGSSPPALWSLGIDIGALDLCILVGYPGTIMATWQRSGRVGRRSRDSLIILVAQEDALDQHFIRNPRDFFDRAVEAAVLNPDNTVIIKRHLLCACAEAVLAVDDPLLVSEAARSALAEMEAAGELLLSGDGRFWFTPASIPIGRWICAGPANRFRSGSMTGRKRCSVRSIRAVAVRSVTPVRSICIVVATGWLLIWILTAGR